MSTIERYRPATHAEIQQAASEIEAYEDWEQAYDYAAHLFGPTVAKVKLNVDHNFDDGEESRYIAQGHRKSEKHQGWDSDDNELPQLFDPDNPDWEKDEEAPGLHTIDPWHMEFDFLDGPQTRVLYIKEES